MASRLSFRQHILLLVFLDLFILTFMFLGSNSIIYSFITGKGALTGVIITAILSMFIGFSAIGTSSQSLGGLTGIIGSLFAKTIAGLPIMLPVFAVISDYVLIYGIITTGASEWIKIIATLIFLPFILDAVFSSIDWARGTNT